MLLKVGHHRPASKTPLVWRFAGVSIITGWKRTVILLQNEHTFTKRQENTHNENKQI